MSINKAGLIPVSIVGCARADATSRRGCKQAGASPRTSAIRRERSRYIYRCAVGGECAKRYRLGAGRDSETLAVDDKRARSWRVAVRNYYVLVVGISGWIASRLVGRAETAYCASRAAIDSHADGVALIFASACGFYNIICRGCWTWILGSS